MYQMFYFCKRLKEIDLSVLDTSNVEDMSEMFKDSSEVEIIKLGNKFTCENLEKANGMFYGCCALKDLDLSMWKSNKVDNMEGMFSQCGALKTIKFSEEFKTENVENMDNLFYGCQKIVSLDLSFWDTQKVDHMSKIFSGCNSLINLKISDKFVTKQVTNLNGTFDGCPKLSDSIKDKIDPKWRNK